MARGKLVFKGEKAKKKKNRSKNKSGLSGADKADDAAVATADGESAQRTGAAVAAATSAAIHEGDRGDADVADDTPTEVSPQMKEGTGSITTSQNVCQGHGTVFKNQLRAGDAIVARTKAGAEEMRVVTMVLSNVSISLSSPFSTDLSTPTSFRYICKPRNDKKERAVKAQRARREQEEVETRAMGTYGGNQEIIYREKTAQGGYRIRKERATTEMSRSDLMDIRSKKKSDRYC